MTDVNAPPAVIERPRALRFVLESLCFIARWFFIFPILGAVVALLAGVVTFHLIAGFGIPDLFWRLTVWKMLLTGASLAVVFALVCFVGYLLESETSQVREREIKASGYFWRTFPVLTLVYVIGALRFKFEPGVVTKYAHGWVSVAGYALGVAFVLVMSYVIVPAIWQWTLAAPMRKTVKAVVRASEDNVPLHGYATIVAGVLTVTYIALAIWVPPIPSATAICILLSIVIMAYGFVRFTARNLSFLVFVLAVLLSGFINVTFPNKHRYPEFGAAAYEKPATIPEDGGAPNSNLIDNDEAFEAWLRNATHGTEKPRLALVSAGGGGIRAAVWTTSVLNRLTADIPEFPKHLRVITGASGGMVGAAYYVASLPPTAAKERKLSEMAADSLEPVALSLALRDVPALFMPMYFNDRGVALEQAWQRNAKVMTTKLGALAAGEREGWRPSLIFTPMFVEDGRRAVISNLELSFLARNEGPQIAGASLYSRPAVELQRVLPSIADLSIASVARMNASFPYVSPAAEVPTEPRRHVVDAGYWDNYGVSVSVAWLARNFEQIAKNTSGVVLIQIRDVVQQPENVDASRPRKPGLPLAGFGEFVAPIVGAFRARDSIMILRNDNDVQQIAKAFAGKTNDSQFFTTVVFENPEPSPLSWSLTEMQAANMLDHFEKHANDLPAKRARELKTWWLTPRRMPVSASTAAVLP